MYPERWDARYCNSETIRVVIVCTREHKQLTTVSHRLTYVKVKIILRLREVWHSNRSATFNMQVFCSALRDNSRDHSKIFNQHSGALPHNCYHRWSLVSPSIPRVPPLWAGGKNLVGTSCSRWTKVPVLCNQFDTVSTFPHLSCLLLPSRQNLSSRHVEAYWLNVLLFRKKNRKKRTPYSYCFSISWWKSERKTVFHQEAIFVICILTDENQFLCQLGWKTIQWWPGNITRDNCDGTSSSTGTMLDQAMRHSTNAFLKHKRREQF